MIIRLTDYLFCLSIPVSLPSSIFHTYSISLTITSSSQSAAAHLHISLPSPAPFALPLFPSTAPALLRTRPPSSDVPGVVPILCFRATLSLCCHLLFLICVLKNAPPFQSLVLLPLSFFLLPPFLFSRALQCRCVGDDVRDAAAGVSNSCVYIRVLQPCGLQPVSG